MTFRTQLDVLAVCALLVALPPATAAPPQTRCSIEMGYPCAEIQPCKPVVIQLEGDIIVWCIKVQPILLPICEATEQPTKCVRDGLPEVCNNIFIDEPIWSDGVASCDGCPSLVNHRMILGCTTYALEP